MEENIKLILRNFLDKKDYKSYNLTIRNQIIQYYVKKIQQIDKDYLYSNVVELLETVETNLSVQDIFLFREFYLIENEDNYPEEISKELTLLYKNILEKDNKNET